MLVLALVALTVPAVRHLQEQPSQQLEVRFDVPAAALVRADAASFALSPDGRALVFTGPGERQLWLRTMDSPVARAIEGAVDARSPVWAPDSRSIAFASVSSGALRRMSLDGGAPVTIATVRPFRGMSWSAGDVLLVASAAGIVRLPASGGDLTTVIPAAEGLIYSNPVFLPDGRTFLYLSSRGGQGGGAQEQTAWVASLDAPAGKRLFDTETKVEYVEPGYLLTGDGASLFAYPFDLDRLEVTGDRFAVVQGVSLFSASASAAVAYRPPAAEGSFQLAWVDRTGQQVAPLGPPMTTANEVDLAPDGRYAATVRATNDNFDIWLVEVARGVMTRLTATPTLTRWPMWSPDSRRVAYADGNNLVVTDADGAGTPEILLEDPLSKYSSDWSPDGTFLLYAVQTRSPARSDLWVLPLTGDREPFPFSATGADETRAQFAPDGRWVSYDADDSGRLEVYVRPFQRTGSRSTAGSARGGIPADARSSTLARRAT